MFRAALRKTDRLPRTLQILRHKRCYAVDLGEVLGPRRALAYESPGEPTQVLRSISSYDPVQMGESDVLIRYIVSPINPADLNTIEGTYPSRPESTGAFSKDNGELFIGGNEGLAEVIEVAPGLTSSARSNSQKFEVGDWVVVTKPQSGTWTNWKVVPAVDLLRLPKKRQTSAVTEVFGATIMVNWLTAYGLLTDVDAVQPHSYVLQNGANSGAGQALIQVAKKKKIQTINFVRDRPDFEAVKAHLKGLGATHVFTYGQLLDPSFKKEFARLREDKMLARHAFNCIGGPSATAMASLLDKNGHLISYGGMSKEPLKIPVGLQIFKNLTCHGYWHSKHWGALSRGKQERRLSRLTAWRENDDLKDGLSEVITLKGNDVSVTAQLRTALQRLQQGMVGKKLLLQWQRPKATIKAEETSEESTASN